MFSPFTNFSQFGQSAVASGGGGGMPYTGNLLARWIGDDYSSGSVADASGNGHTMSQAVSGSQPTIYTGGFNGHAAMETNGGEFLTAGVIPLTTGSYTIIAVVQFKSLGGNFLLSKDSDTGRGLGVGIGGGWYIEHGGGGAFNAGTSDTAENLIVYRYDASITTSEVIVNGVSQGGNSSSAAPGSGTGAEVRLFNRQYPGSPGSVSARLADISFFTEFLSSGNLALNSAYLTSLYL